MLSRVKDYVTWGEIDKAIYQGFQKLLVIIMIFVEAIPQAFGFLVPDSGLVSNIAHVVPE